MACTIDFRNLDEGFGGKTYKRKRAAAENILEDKIDDGSSGMEIDLNNPPSKRQAVASMDDPDKPKALAAAGGMGRASYDGVIAGKVSGRKWKQPRTRRASASKVSLKRTTVEQRMKEKEIKKAYKERKEELKEEIRKHKVEKRKQREEREKRKKENTLRSGTKLQKITNPNTLRRIAKSSGKKRKLLKQVPDNFFNSNPGTTKR